MGQVRSLRSLGPPKSCGSLPLSLALKHRNAIFCAYLGAMKKLFLAIRHSRLDEVKELIGKKPELVNCTAKQPPKKDDGQSPLQVALKTGNFDIADYLIEMGANVNWIEESEVNEWRAPVIHDAIRAAIFSCRFPVSYGKQNTKETAERALRTLNNLIAKGANVHANDSYGNNCAMRAVLDVRQFNDRLDSNELLEDLKDIMKQLRDAGVDFQEKTQTSEEPLEFIRGEPAMVVFQFE